MVERQSHSFCDNGYVSVNSTVDNTGCVDGLEAMGNSIVGICPETRRFCEGLMRTRIGSALLPQWETVP